MKKIRIILALMMIVSVGLAFGQTRKGSQKALAKATPAKSVRDCDIL